MSIILAAVLALLQGSSVQGPKEPVHVVTVESAINPPAADYIRSAIEEARAAGAQALVIRLNTPGGLLKSTRSIVSDLLQAPLPVIVYVSPSGAQAASAGVFVTLAAHVAAMAPGTNIGAAHPVLQGETMDSIMSEKATNDAAAFIRSISEKRKRNIRWAEESVRRSLSITESEALKEKVVDLVASDLRELLDAIDGRTVEVAGRSVTLSTRGAPYVEIEKTVQQEILDIISDPNVAYILMMLGIYGLMFELYNPGSILPGIVGVISLILAFYSLHTLPVNYAGVGLILFAVVLFLLEIKVVSHGLLTVGGVAALALGSVLLFERSSFLEMAEISWEVILAATVVTVLFFLFVVGLGLRAQRRAPSTGAEGIVGEEGTAIEDLRPSGQVKVHGEIWTAVSSGGEISRGDRIVVEKSENLRLIVHRKE